MFLAYPEQRLGKADQVIEVSLGRKDLSRSNGDRSEHLLGGRFPRTPRDRNDREGKSPPPQGGNVTQGPEGVGDADHRQFLLSLPLVFRGRSILMRRPAAPLSVAAAR